MGPRPGHWAAPSAPSVVWEILEHQRREGRALLGAGRARAALHLGKKCPGLTDLPRLWALPWPSQPQFPLCKSRMLTYMRTPGTEDPACLTSHLSHSEGQWSLGCFLIFLFYVTLKNLIFRDREESGEGRKETRVCCFTYLCLHWLLYQMCALTWG